MNATIKPETALPSEPQARSSALLDALSVATNDYEKKAVDGLECGPEWKIAIRALVREVYQDGFRDGLKYGERSASNDQADSPPRKP